MDRRPQENIRIHNVDVLPQSRKIYPGFESLSFITTHTYEQLKVARYVFGAWVSPAAFDYYAAVASTMNTIRTLRNNGYSVFAEEDRLCNIIENLDLNPPAPITAYLKAMYKVSVHDGNEYRILHYGLQYEVGNNGIPGYFGRVGILNHWQYAAYPCLAVYAQRIKQDILFTEGKDNKQWNLPENIRPELHTAGFPTENMLGWKPAEMINWFQTEFLKLSGYDSEGNCNFSSKLLPLNIALLANIQKELNEISVQEAPFHWDRIQRSTSLLAITETTDENCVGPILLGNLKVRSFMRMEDTQGLSSVYRLFRNPGNGNWCVYEWNKYQDVPPIWRQTCNVLRRRESVPVMCNNYLYGPFSLNFVVKNFVGTYFNQTR